jgi:hypothetical protein
MPAALREEPTAALCEVHAVARLCRARTADALAVLGSANGFSSWNLGMRLARDLGTGIYEGRSIVGGGTVFARVQVEGPQGRIRYAVGSDKHHLVQRIEARVQDGIELGYAKGTCVVTLLAWRSADINDERWRQLVAVHEVEIDLTRAAVEAFHAAASRPAPAKKRGNSAAARGGART